MRSIAIVLDDNDFGKTFMSLLESIKLALSIKPDLTKEVIELAIRSGIEFHYLAYQLGNNLGQKGYMKVEDTVKYLQANIKILFDTPAEKDSMIDHDGGAWFLDVTYGGITPY